MELLDVLKSKISKCDNVEQVVNVFEDMCQIPVDNDLMLYSTGIFEFTGEPLFHFSLVRQFPDDEEEYYQIHVDVMYQPDSENDLFSDVVWNDEVEGDFFDYIRSSSAYRYAVDHKYVKIGVYKDET